MSGLARTLRRTLAAWALAGLTLASPAQEAPAACPPVAQPPTAAQLQAAQAGARDRGFLWRITRDGRTSWLYGTVHLGRLDWAYPGPALRAAIASADVLALELDVTDPATLREITAALAAGPTLNALPADVSARLRRQIAAACLPAQALDAQHPVMRVVTLTLLAARWEGLDPALAQETLLAGAARARGLPIIALETAASQMAALVPADPGEALQDVVSGLSQLESGAARRGAARLAQAWAEQRLDDLERYEHWCECVANDQDRAQMARLNDGRNPALADGIEALHAQGRQVLAAVGALHMTGPQALPRLLAQRGFSVQRVAFPP